MNNVRLIEIGYRDYFLKSGVGGQLIISVFCDNSEKPTYYLISNADVPFHKHLGLYLFLSSLGKLPYIYEFNESFNRFNVDHNFDDVLKSAKRLQITKKTLMLVHKILKRSISSELMYKSHINAVLEYIYKYEDN